MDGQSSGRNTSGVQLDVTAGGLVSLRHVLLRGAASSASSGTAKPSKSVASSSSRPSAARAPPSARQRLVACRGDEGRGRMPAGLGCTRRLVLALPPG